MPTSSLGNRLVSAYDRQKEGSYKEDERERWESIPCRGLEAAFTALKSRVEGMIHNVKCYLHFESVFFVLAHFSPRRLVPECLSVSSHFLHRTILAPEIGSWAVRIPDPSEIR